MNETIRPNSPSDLPWPTSDQRVRVPDTSMLPGSEKAAPAGIGLLNSAVQGAHDGIDRLASSAAPAVRQLGDSVAAAEVALRARSAQLRETRDEWADSLRSSVRGSPLAAIAIAAALGVVIGRITR